MNTVILYLSLTPILASPLDQGAAVELRYSGTLEPTGRDASGVPVKRFSFYNLLTKSESGGHDLAFVMEERGGGSWFWPERFGTLKLDRSNTPGGTQRIKVLYEHNETVYPLLVQQPLFEFANQIEDGATWASGRYQYKVGSTKKIGDYNCREIQVSSNFGRAHTIWVDAESTLVVKAELRVVVGQGEIYKLSTELKSTQAVDSERLTTLNLPLQQLLNLKAALKRKTDDLRTEFKPEHVKLISSEITNLEKNADATPFSKLVSSIRRDLKLQVERSEGVETLVKRFTGQQASKFKLKSLTGRAIDPKDYEGKIVLLHFWKYNDEPLREPYGQVGYLDFLNSRREKMDVKIYGVAIDPRLTDKSTHSSAIRDIRKLTKFMNLAYTVTADDGTLLRQFGDPRRAGAELPLWVLVDPDGKIAHYKVGFYEINRDQGLRDLDLEIIMQIRKLRAKKSEK